MPGRQGVAFAWFVAAALSACAHPHVRQPIEEEPFVLSPGPPLSVREELARREGELAGREGELSGGTGELGPEAATTKLEAADRSGRTRVVHARVAGQPTLLLLDTGAFDHILQGWFAQQLQDASPTGKSTQIVDAANRRLSVDRLGLVPFAVDGWSALAPIHPLIAGDSFTAARGLGVGGIVSPQRLLPVGGGVIVIDLPAAQMSTADAAEGARRLAGRGRSLGAARRCGGTYVLDATLEGHAARLVVDTGAWSTGIKSSSAPGKALSGRSSVSRETYALGGAVTTRSLSDVALSAGDFATKVDVNVMATAAPLGGCAADGLLGMDVLARCVLVVAADTMGVACE